MVDVETSAAHPAAPTARPPELVLSDRLLAGVHAAALAAYPEECCGVLIGREVHDHGHVLREVVRTIPVPNAWPGAREDRYLIPADIVREVEREARRDGLEIVGYYHSHPDGEAVPSPFDLEVAWPWYSYLIVAVRGVEGERRDVGVRGWQLRDDRATFLEQRIRIRSGASEVKS